MHREHLEHLMMGGEPLPVRLEARDMAQITLVVRCRGVRKIRLRLAMALMRMAGKLGGFNQVQLLQDSSKSR